MDCSVKRGSSLRRLFAEVNATNPSRLFAFAADKGVRLAGPLVSSKLCIFRYDTSAARPTPPTGFQLMRFSHANDVPANLSAQVRASGLDGEFEHNFVQGGDLWLGVVNGKLAVSLWTIQRMKLTQWHIPITPDDTVLYSVVTQPSFRGLGLTGIASTEIWRRIGQANSAFYVDCKVWNRSAQRAFIKAGFKHVVTVPPHR